jgi:TPR repeat protein
MKQFLSKKAAMTTLLGCALTSPFGAAKADAKADGDRGIEEYANGNLIESIQLLEKSANEGYVRAQVFLAYILDQGEQDLQAFHWYQRAAESSDPAGLFGLGSMYAKGEGTEKNPILAGILIRQAARLDHMEAMRAYAYALENGNLGFPQDHAGAAEWFVKAAAAGDQVSMRRLMEAKK